VARGRQLVQPLLEDGHAGAPTPSGGIETRPTLHEAVRRAADLVGGFKLAARAARRG
jgi:hypothetical protein